MTIYIYTYFYPQVWNIFEETPGKSFGASQMVDPLALGNQKESNQPMPIWRNTLLCQEMHRL